MYCLLRKCDDGQRSELRVVCIGDQDACTVAHDLLLSNGDLRYRLRIVPVATESVLWESADDERVLIAGIGPVEWCNRVAKLYGGTDQSCETSTMARGVYLCVVKQVSGRWEETYPDDVRVVPLDTGKPVWSWPLPLKARFVVPEREVSHANR